MRVLNGKPAWRYRLTCTGKGNFNEGCGADLEVEQDDLFNSNTWTRPFITFECPVCGAWSDLPDYVRLPEGKEPIEYPMRRRDDEL